MECGEISLGVLISWKLASEDAVRVITKLPNWLGCPTALAGRLVTVEFPLAAAGARCAASCLGL